MSVKRVAVCSVDWKRTRVEGRVQDGAVDCELDCLRGW